MQFPEIRGQKIRLDSEGRASALDIYKLAGSPRNRDPRQWRRLSASKGSAVALAERLNQQNHRKQNVGKSHIKAEISAETVLYAEKGRLGGTWLHPVLALEYAGYLSPELRVEIHDVFLRYKLGDAALADDILQRAPSEANEWVARRALSRAKRNEFTATLANHEVHGRGFADCTNANYRGLMDKTASELRAERGLPAKTNLRDHMTSDELVAVMMSEVMSKNRIEALDNRGNSECEDSCLTSSRNLRRMFEAEAQDIQERLQKKEKPEGA